MRTCGRRLAARLTSFVGWPAKSALAPGGRILTLKVMQFAPQQDEALKAVSQWLKGGRSQLFRLFGYAGTGKTTLARHFAENVDGEVVFAAFTGKAAQVLRSKGATNAKTIHSLIYRPRGEEEVEDEETGKTSIAPMFAINRQSPVAKAALIIVDECSMVDEALGKDLMSFGTPILVLGDPGQLPPVPAAATSPIRTGFSPDGYPSPGEGQPYHPARHAGARGQGDHARRLRHRPGHLQGAGDTASGAGADQVLVGTNRTRRRYNQRLRELKGFTSEYPQSGDKLVCLRNDPAKGLLNGSLWQVMSSSKETVKPGINLMIRPEDDDMDRGAAKIKLLKAAVEDVEGEIPWSTRKRYDEFDYGYALTVHKAQGSQWNNVVLFDESWAFRDTRERWLYTAITRAAERLTIVR